MFLNAGNWITSTSVEVEIRKPHKYEVLAPEVERLRSKNVPKAVISRKLGVSMELVNGTLDYVETGRPPIWRKPGKRNGMRAGRTPKYIAISSEFVRLRDVEELSIPRIVKWFADNKGISVSESTVVRAYDYGRPDAVKRAADQGTNISRGRYSHLRRDTKDLVKKLLEEGLAMKIIADRAGCSRSTVRRIRHRIDEGGSVNRRSEMCFLS